MRLILQRLLKSTTNSEVLKPICNTLALLCVRDPLKQFVVLKILQKMDQVFENYALPVLPIANSLGFDAIQSIVLPNLALFLSRTEKGELPFIYSILVRRLSPSSPNYYFRYLFRNRTTFSVKRAYSTRPSTTRFATTSATRWPSSTKPRNV